MLTNFLNKKSMAVGLKAKDKNELLIKMVDLAMNTENIIDKEQVLSEIMQRERIMSTGIGKGIALPHAKTKAIKCPVIAIATLDQPVNFDSLDNKPVEIVLLMLGEANKVTEHLKHISEISHLFSINNILEAMLSCRKVNELYDVIYSQLK